MDYCRERAPVLGDSVCKATTLVAVAGSDRDRMCAQKIRVREALKSSEDRDLELPDWDVVARKNDPGNLGTRGEAGIEQNACLAARARNNDCHSLHGVQRARQRCARPAARSLLPGRHSDGAVQSDALTIKVAVGDHLEGERGI